MGLYNVGLDLASSPTDELVSPLNRSLFAVYARLRHDLKHLATHYERVLSAVITVSCSTAIGVALVSQDLVMVVLGDKWVEAAPLIAWLAWGHAIEPVLASMGVVLNVTGHVKRSAHLTWLRVLLMAPAFAIAGSSFGVEMVAAARVVIIVVMAPLTVYSLCQVLPLNYREVLALFWRPALASLGMVLVVVWLRPYFGPFAAVRLALSVVTGAVAFSSVQLLLWWLVGCPDGIEPKVLRTAMRLGGFALRAPKAN